MKRSIQRSCAQCGGYIRFSNSSGYCTRTSKCRKAMDKFWNGNKRGCGNKLVCSNCKETLVYSYNVTGICRAKSECKRQNTIVYESVYREIYGLYFVDRKNMWLEQGKTCYLCWELLAFEDSHVDHDHTHKACNGNGCRHCVRGLAHQSCNQLIGFANDNEQKIHLIADNLQRVSKGLRSSWEEYNG